MLVLSDFIRNSIEAVTWQGKEEEEEKGRRKKKETRKSLEEVKENDNGN